MNQISCVAELINHLGGSRAVADIFGVTQNAVGNWRQANRLPAHTFHSISALLQKDGLEADPLLWTFERKKKERGEVTRHG